MRRLLKGIVIGIAAVSLYAVPAYADAPGEVLLEHHILKDLKASKKSRFRVNVGKLYLHRDFGADDIQNLNIQIGGAAYKGYFFGRVDGNFNVHDDEEDPFSAATSGYGGAIGIQQPLGSGPLVGGAWIGYQRFNTEIEGLGDEVDFDVHGPYVGAGLNWTFTGGGKPSPLSAFLGGRIYFATSESDDFEDIGVDAGLGFEAAIGLRYHLNPNFYLTGGFKYLTVDLDTEFDDNDMEDLVGFFNVGYTF
jgi:hypothetical protein